MMMMLMLSRSSFSGIQTVTNKTWQATAISVSMAETKIKQYRVLLYVYTSTPLQQYHYVPKETVRHQASCEEVRRASQVSHVLLYSSNSSVVFVGRVLHSSQRYLLLLQVLSCTASRCHGGCIAGFLLNFSSAAAVETKAESEPLTSLSGNLQIDWAQGLTG